MAEKAGSLRSSDEGDSGAGSLRSPPAKDSSSKKTESADSSESLTEPERAQAIAELRFFAAGHREAIDAMLDGVILGAEQVQDKRIELLEAGPDDQSLLNVPLIAFVLTFVLEGSIGPSIASLLCRHMLRPLYVAIAGGIAKTEKAGRLKDVILMLREHEREVKDIIRTVKRGRYRDWKEIARELRKDADTLEASSKVLSLGEAKKVVQTWRDLTQQLPLNMVAGVKAVRERALRETVLPLNPGRSSGVSVVGAAMEEAAAMRLVVAAATESNTVVLMQPNASLDEAKEILTAFRPNTFELSVLRDTFALLSEAMIWAKHLNLSTPIDSSGEKIVLTSAIDSYSVKEKRLRDYLRPRFLEAATEWLGGKQIIDNREKDPDPPSAGTPYPDTSSGLPLSLAKEEGGGFSGPRDIVTPEEKLRNGLKSRGDELVNYYLGAIGSKTTILAKELS